MISMTYYRRLVFLALLLSSLAAFATIFGTVSGLIHDPQHRPVQGAQLTLGAANSAWTKLVTSDESGEFHFEAVPLGEYTVKVELAGFGHKRRNSSSAPVAMPAFTSRLPSRGARRRSKSAARRRP